MSGARLLAAPRQNSARKTRGRRLRIPVDLTICAGSTERPGLRADSDTHAPPTALLCQSTSTEPRALRYGARRRMSYNCTSTEQRPSDSKWARRPGEGQDDEVELHGRGTHEAYQSGVAKVRHDQRRIGREGRTGDVVERHDKGCNPSGRGSGRPLGCRADAWVSTPAQTQVKAMSQVGVRLCTLIRFRQA